MERKNGGCQIGMKISAFTVGAFQENSYLVQDEQTGGAVMIDPGGDADVLIAAVESSGARLEAIWITHAHLDHIGAVAALKRRWPVPVHLHPADWPLYRVADRQAQVYGLPFEEPPPPDAELAEGDELALGGLSFAVMHAPGHSPGHVVLHGHGVAFVGDCLFAGSVGRTDLPASSGADLVRSLERIATLPPETVVYPGHGPATTVGEELATNPFLNGAARIPV
jgi:hydroxyacylglutathione hydrolase